MSNHRPNRHNRHSRHGAPSDDLLAIMQQRRQRAARNESADTQSKKAVAKRRSTPKRRGRTVSKNSEKVFTPAQQRRNSIIAFTLIPVTIFGMGTAAAKTLYDDIAKPVMTSEDNCQRVTKKFNTVRDETQQLILGGTVAQARERAGLSDQDTLALDDVSSSVFSRLGDSSTAIQTLLTTTLMIENPQTIPDDIDRTGTYTIAEVVSRPSDNVQEGISGTRADDSDDDGVPQHRLDRVDYAKYINENDHSNKALARLSETVLKSVNGDYDTLLTTPECLNDDDVRDVAVASGNVANLRNKVQDDIDALAAQLRFAEVDSWCGTRKDSEHTREAANSTIDRNNDLRNRIEKVRDKRGNLAGDFDQHISDLEQIAQHVERLRDHITDTPACLVPGISATDIESQHNVIVKYHSELDDLYMQIMSASAAVDQHEVEVKDLLHDDNEERKKKRQELEAKQREAEQKAQREAEQRQREAEQRQREREQRQQQREREREAQSTSASPTSTNNSEDAGDVDSANTQHSVEPMLSEQRESDTYIEEPTVEYYEE